MFSPQLCCDCEHFGPSALPKQNPPDLATASFAWAHRKYDMSSLGDIRIRICWVSALDTERGKEIP